MFTYLALAGGLASFLASLTELSEELRLINSGACPELEGKILMTLSEAIFAEFSDTGIFYENMLLDSGDFIKMSFARVISFFLGKTC